jgi:lysozyme family protein
MTRDQAIALMLRIEGGEANVEGDPGGHTKYGVTQATLTRVSTQALLKNLPANVADLTPEQAALVYKTTDWTIIRGDELPSALAPLMLNAAVNMGDSRAVMLLQEAVGVTVDGLIGPATLYAVRAWRSRYMPDQSLAEEFAAHMAARYAFIDNRNANLSQFELGWFRRLFRVYTLAVST